MPPLPDPDRITLRQALAAIAKALIKFSDDEADALTWGGPTIHAKSPIDARNARTVGKAILTLLRTTHD